MTSATQTVASLPSSTFMPELDWQDSIDQPCGLLKNCYRCWTAKGLAREIFETIAEPIRTVLESRSDDLDKGQIVPQTIGFTLYMISLRVFSSTSVRPTLLIECKNSTVRDRAKSVIKQSRIWRTTLIQHPHLRLATCARGPRECAGENPKAADYWIWDKSRQDYYHAELDRNGDWQYTWARSTPRVPDIPSSASYSYPRSLPARPVSSGLSESSSVRQSFSHQIVPYPGKLYGRGNQIYHSLPRPHSPLILPVSNVKPSSIPPTLAEDDESTIYTDRTLGDLCGAPIFVSGHSDQITLPQRNFTLGGILLIDDVPMGVTVAHPFKGTSLTSDDTTDIEDDEFAFDSGEDLNDSVTFGLKNTSHSKHEDADSPSGLNGPDSFGKRNELDVANEYSMADDRHITETLDSSVKLDKESREEEDKLTTRNKRSPAVALGRLQKSSAEFDNDTLDWAIFSFTDSRHWRPNTIKLPGKTKMSSFTIEDIQSDRVMQKNTFVLAITSSNGVIEGSLYRTPYYLRIGGTQVFQKTWTVCLERSAVDGDCGAWIVHSQNYRWIGQIVARRPRSNLVFITRASHIVKDIQARLRAKVEILTKYNHPEIPNISLSHSGEFGRDNLDPKLYKQIPYKTYKFFVVGKVFMMLYIENDGPPGPPERVFGGTNFTTVASGEAAHHQFRRFVVVEERSDQYFCYCCPITTYSGQATTKPGVDQSAHTIIYTGKKPPEKLEGEKGMSKDPLRVLLRSTNEKLDPLSRINLGKVQPIQHHWKVREIGDIEPKNLRKLIQYYKAVRDK